MDTNSKEVSTNQHGPALNLKEIVQKHFEREYLRPVANHSRAAFEAVKELLIKKSGRLIFDSGCGTGESTAWLADQHPKSFVVGIDKSEFRLEKHPATAPDSPSKPKNYRLVRADLVDFWRLALAAEVRLQKHYLLYPNPWPKEKHLMRRWYAHPVFPTVLSLGGALEVRTNWKLYIDEMCEVLLEIGGISFHSGALNPQAVISPFERKFLASGHELLYCKVDLDDSDFPRTLEAPTKRAPLLQVSYRSVCKRPLL